MSSDPDATLVHNSIGDNTDPSLIPVKRKERDWEDEADNSDYGSESEDGEEQDDYEHSDAHTKVRRRNILSPQRLWKKHVHHNGSIYYRSTKLRLVTTDNVYDNDTLAQLLHCRERAMSLLESSKELCESLSDCELYIVSDKLFDESKIVGFVSYGSRTVLPLPAPGRSAPSLSGPSFWWKVLEICPMHLEGLPALAETEFLGALTFGANERALEHKDTVFPFTDSQTERLLQIYRSLKEKGQRGLEVDTTSAVIWHIARVMFHIEQRRQRYGYGTKGARIYRNVAHPLPTTGVKILDVVLGVLLFGTHSAYRKRLENVRVKEEVYVHEFHEFVRNLLREWADTNLIATVFVSANVAFLAIPGIDDLQRTASLASTLFSMMSVASGMHHVWQHRGRTDAEHKEAHNYLYHMRQLGALDMTVTSAFLSLPIASLLWSVLCFTVALGALCLARATLLSRILFAGLIAIGVICGLSMLWFFWKIWRDYWTIEIEEDYEYNLDNYETDSSSSAASLKRRRRTLLAWAVSWSAFGFKLRNERPARAGVAPEDPSPSKRSRVHN